MKYRISLLMVLAFSICGPASAQKTFNDSLALSRNRITQKAMITLGTWSVLNIASGFIIAGQTHGEAHYAWQMNAYWNFINLGLSAAALLQGRHSMGQPATLDGNVNAQEAIGKLYAVNFGLDVAYMIGGFYLRERGNRETIDSHRDRFKGYGTSLVVQGAFLFFMDGIMLHIHHQNSLRLQKHLRELEISSGPNGLGVLYHF